MKKTFNLWNKEGKELVKVEARKVGKEWRAFCPWHPDEENPNLDINEEKEVYLCRACQRAGRLFGSDYQNPEAKKNLKSLKVPEHKELEKMAKEFAENLKNNSDFRTFLKEGRGLSDTVIEKYQLGYARVHPKYENSGERLTMPIYKDGKCVNIRFHSFRNKKAKDLPYTEDLPYATWLYPEDQLKNHELYLCEGELDALCAISHGLSAITVTGGAGTWKKEFNPLFKGKKVNIIYDCDLAGRKGASKVTQQLQGIARVKNIDLGLNEGEDLTNWFVDYGKSKEELEEKIAKSTTVAFLKDHPVSPDEPKRLKDVILEIEDFKALKLPEKRYCCIHG